MDAFELTRPILSSTRLVARRSLPRATRPAGDADALLVEARRFVHQLPLGLSPGPALDRVRLTAAAAPAAIERALWRTAAAFAVCASSDESPNDLARRLVRARAIVPPAADALVVLLPAIEEGAGGEGARLAERLIGYLDHRAETGPRFRRRR